MSPENLVILLLFVLAPLINVLVQVLRRRSRPAPAEERPAKGPGPAPPPSPRRGPPVPALEERRSPARAGEPRLGRLRGGTLPPPPPPRPSPRRRPRWLPGDLRQGIVFMAVLGPCPGLSPPPEASPPAREPR